MVLAILLLAFAGMHTIGTLFAVKCGVRSAAFIVAYNACVVVIMVLAAIALL